MIVSGYLRNELHATDREHRIERSLEALRPLAAYFDSIAVRGVSGLLMGPVFARELKKHLIVARKNDGSHSTYSVEGEDEGAYLIVDDFVSSGETVRAIRREIERAFPKARHVATWLYSRSELRLPPLETHSWTNEDSYIFKARHGDTPWASWELEHITAALTQERNDAAIAPPPSPPLAPGDTFTMPVEYVPAGTGKSYVIPADRFEELTFNGAPVVPTRSIWRRFTSVNA